MCKLCRHRIWTQIRTFGGHWTICTCPVRKFNFGLEIDVYENKGDRKRGVDAMPSTCWKFEKRDYAA